MSDILERELCDINVLSENMDFVINYVGLKDSKKLPITQKIEYYIDSYNLVNDMNLLIEQSKHNDQLLETLKITQNGLIDLQLIIDGILKRILEINENLNNYDKHLLYSTLAKIDNNENYTINNLSLIELYPQEIIDGYANKEYLFYNDFISLNHIANLNDSKLDFSQIDDKYKKENKSDILFIQESYKQYFNLKTKYLNEIKTFEF